MNGDVNNTSGNTSSTNSNLPPTTSTQGVDGTGELPPEQETGETAQLQNDFIQKSESLADVKTPDAAYPKMLQPEIQQMLLSSSDALKFMLFNNLVNLNNNGGDSKDIKIAAQLYGMDDSMLHRMSQMGYNIDDFQALEAEFSDLITEIISYSWEKFNEVTRDLYQRDMAWLRSSAKQYLDYINSSKFQDKLWNANTPIDEKIKINKGAAEFEEFLSSIPAAEKEELLGRLRQTGQVPQEMYSYLMSSSVLAFGEAFAKVSSKENTNANLHFVLSTVISNAGFIMSHPPSTNAISFDQATSKLIHDGLVHSHNAVPLAAVDPNTLIMLGYVGVMFANASGPWSSLETVAATKAQVKTPDQANVEFAKRYAMHIAQFVNSSAFEAGVLAVISNRYSKSPPPTDEQKAEMVSRLRILILSNALAVLHSARHNSPMTGLTWSEAIKNPSALKEGAGKDPLIGDIEYSLATYIHTYLPKDPGVRSKLEVTLRDLYDSKPSKTDLLTTNKAIQSAFTDVQIQLPVNSQG